MKHIIFTSSLLLVSLPMLFSCEHKTENTTTELAQVPALTITEKTKNNKKQASSWIIDASASKVEFTISNFGMDVNGTFGGLKGTIFFDDKNLEGSSFEGEIDVNTISTGISKRDKDLQEEKYFDTEKNKHIIFQSGNIVRAGNSYKAIGNLAIKGKSSQRSLPFVFEQNGNKGVFKSQFTFNRLDFGVGGTGPIMGDDVNVSLNIVVNKK